MKLYEISDAIRTVIDGGIVLNEETGEVFEDTAGLDQLNWDFEDKVEACACVYKEIVAEADAIASERKRLMARENGLRRRAESLRGYVQSCMESCGKKRVETARAKVTSRKTSSVAITDETAVPELYLRHTWSPDKTAIRKALKAGMDVPGAAIEEKASCSIG